MKYLYKYPQNAFPYDDLLKENARRTKEEPEYQIIDTGIFNEDRYWDIIIETAKEDDDPDELLFRVTAWNRGPDPAPLHIMPHVWFRNTWSWGREPADKKPSIQAYAPNMAKSNHHSLGERYVLFSPSPGVGPSGRDVIPEMLYTENDTNYELLYGSKNESPYVKDAFHRYVIDGDKKAVNPAQTGTKSAAWFRFDEAGGVGPGECAGKFITGSVRGVEKTCTNPGQWFVSVFQRGQTTISTRRSSMSFLRRRSRRPMSSTPVSAPCPWRMICATSSGRPLQA